MPVQAGERKKGETEMAKISDFKPTNPYPDAEYAELDSILDKQITLIDAEVFENKKGKGAHILAQIDGKEIRLCTHAVAIADLLAKEELQNALKSGDYIVCKFVKVKSESNPERQVIKLVDVEDA